MVMNLTTTTTPNEKADLKHIFSTWWPLAFSWLLMGVELPGVSAIIARLPDPEINLAAYGGVVFPIALIIESPVIMLLAASTALSKDWASYAKMRQFMLVTSGVLTLVQIIVAYTPIYYIVVGGIIGAPQEIIEPARAGLQILLPWTFSIAFRRFNQGVLIRFGHSRYISIGTIVRLSVNWSILLAGYLIGTIPGIMVGSSAVALGVLCEAIFVGVVTRPVLRKELRYAPIVTPALTYKSFLNFYIPLAMTSLLMLLANPIGSAAISRMPNALASLAVWPVVTGLLFIFRSMGMAFNEVVVAMLDEPSSSPNLRKFALLLAGGTTAGLLLITLTPLSNFWFEKVSALPPELADLAKVGLWLGLPLPALSVMQSWYQGAILFGKRTRGITESMAIYLGTNAAIQITGVVWAGITGLYVGMAALSISVLTQTLWLRVRSTGVMNLLKERDQVPAVV